MNTAEVAVECAALEGTEGAYVARLLWNLPPTLEDLVLLEAVLVLIGLPAPHALISVLSYGHKKQRKKLLLTKVIYGSLFQAKP